jgi:capsular exopolysaccharide synthesis family protein
MQSAGGGEVNLANYWSVVRRRRWLILSALAVAVVVGAAYAFTVTPIYQATAQVIVDEVMAEATNFVPNSGGQFRDPVQYYDTQKEILSSRRFLDYLARRLQLDKDPYFGGLARKRRAPHRDGPQGEGAAPAGPSGARQQAVPPPSGDAPLTELDPLIVDVLHAGLRGEVGKAQRIMNISYLAQDPVVAAAIANGAAEALIAYNLGMRVKPYEAAAEWLAAKIAESRTKVEKMEQNMEGYREVKGDQTIIAHQLQVLITQLGESENRKLEAESRLKKIQAAVSSPEGLLDNRELLANPIMMGFRTEEQALARQLADLSEKYGPQHPQIIKVTAQLKQVRANIAGEARATLDAARADVENAENRSAALRRSLDDKRRELLASSREELPYYFKGGEASSSKSFYELLSRKLEEMTLTIASSNVSVLQIMEPARIPKQPIKPRRGLVLQFSLLAGLFAGLFLAFFAEHLDTAIRSQEDVEQALKVPFLDIVPLLDKRTAPLFIAREPASLAAESLRTIRTGVTLSAIDAPPKVILVTSSVPNEGKTTISANLAVAFAQMGESVLVVDTDMRRHNLHELFGLGPSPGLSDVLGSPETLTASLKSSDVHPNLMVLTGGTTVPNPAEMLGSVRMRQLIAAVSGRFDRVILDAPPLRVFSDALVLSQLADGVILVVWGGSTPRALIQQSIEGLRGVRASMLGVVLNKTDVSRGGGYSSYYATYHDGYATGGKGRKRER